MTASGFEWSTAIGSADWVGPRLSPFAADRVDSVIPAGFAAYARLLHPVWRDHATSAQVRWGEVAAWSGTVLDRHAQFHDVALPRETPAEPAPWDGPGPAEGALTGQDATVLVEILAGHTAGGQRCRYCLWDGYGWDNTVTVTATTGDTPPPEPVMRADPVPGWVRSGPRVRLPARDYLFYTGPVTAALAFVDSQGQTPNLWWPDDRSWCVASEIDLPWTYLAGPRTLIDAVLADPRLEALPAAPDDPIQMRVRGWLAELIDDAVTELAARGATTVTTSRGTVRSRLTRPTRRLHTTTQAVNGTNSSVDGTVEFCSEDDLLRWLRFHMTMTITGLADR